MDPRDDRDSETVQRDGFGAMRQGLRLPAPELTNRQRRELAGQVARQWTSMAACVGTVDDTWFPDVAQPVKRAAAVARCVACPVRRSCLAHALAVEESFGIWGGTTEMQRDALRIDLANGVAIADVLDSATVRPAYLWQRGG